MVLAVQDIVLVHVIRVVYHVQDVQAAVVVTDVLVVRVAVHQHVLLVQAVLESVILLAVECVQQHVLVVQAVLDAEENVWEAVLDAQDALVVVRTLVMDVLVVQEAVQIVVRVIVLEHAYHPVRDARGHVQKHAVAVHLALAVLEPVHNPA